MLNKITLSDLLYNDYTSKIQTIQSLTFDLGLMLMSLILLNKFKLLILSKYTIAVLAINESNSQMLKKYGRGVIDIKSKSYITLIK